MRNKFSATVLVLSIVFFFAMSGQSSAQLLSITNYKLQSQKPVSLTKWLLVYKADLVNQPAANPSGAGSASGTPFASVTATLSIPNPTSLTIVPQQNVLHFAPVPANSQVTSTNDPITGLGATFTLLYDRTGAPDPNFATLVWTFVKTPVAPVANAGLNQGATVGKTVTLDGSGSTNPSGIGTLTFSWAFKSVPPGSTAAIANPTSVNPTFVPDVQGTYVITLTVSNGTASNSADVTVSTTNPPPPVANAGPDQTVTSGATVVLNGSKSTSGSGNPLTYSWTLTNPPGSTATLTGANTVSPTFVADKPNATWTATLVVNDGIASSAPSMVHITTGIVAPVAMAGSNQMVNVNATVQLNGSGSTDANGLPLSYSWSLITLPAGSHAALSSTTVVNPTFVADAAGTYMAQLIVNNGTLPSAPSVVTITTNPPLAPTANAGPTQTVAFNALVQLNGSGTDSQNLPLSFSWQFNQKPAGSIATLSSATIANPTFTADKTGTFILQLTTNNGFLPSAPSTVMISTTCTQPTANAGPDQNVTVGATVTLNGNGSSDACHDTLTYSWTLLTKPQGSNATLNGATTVSPTFVADVAGNFVAQLIVNNGFQASTPITVTISASPQPVISLTPNPLDVAANGTGTLTVTLSTAPTTDQVINLSGGAGVVTIPPTVTILKNQTSATATVTPVATGTATITGAATGMVSGTATVNVIAQLTITTASLPNGIVNVAYPNTTVASSGGKGTLTWSISGQPAGLSINSSTGVISGTPTATGTSNNVVVTVTDSSAPTPQTASKTYAITINPALAITTASLPNGIVNAAYPNTTVASANGAGTLTWSISGQPTGLSINASTGVISGTPTATGTSNNVVVTVTDSSTPPQSANKTYTIIINAGLAITTASLPNGVVNLAYPNTTVASANGVGTLTWSISGQPTGLSINASTGVISGTPTATGTSNNVVVAVTDSSTPPQTANKTYTIIINPALAITTASLPNGIVNTAYPNTTVAAANGVGTLTWSISGQPTGLSINTSTGVISGTPTTTGTSSNVVVTVTDSSSPTAQTATKTYSITILPKLMITTAALQNGTVGTPYSVTLAASGGTGGLTWSVTGQPAGLTINASTGVLSGTPTTAGTSSSVLVTVTDSGAPQQTASATFSIIINPSGPPPVPVTITSISVGKALQAPVGISIANAQGTDLTFTVASSNPAIMQINGGNAGVVSSLQVTIPAGQTGVSINLVGVAVGQTTLVATGAGAGQGTETVTPSGFLLSGPSNTPSFTVNQGQTANLLVSVAQLDASGNVLSTQQSVAPAVPPASTVSIAVAISNTNTSVGTVSPASVTFTAGDLSKNTTFTAANTGATTQQSTNLAAGVPTGFNVPAGNANQLTAFVAAIGCTLPASQVGRNLETNNATNGAGLHVTLSGTVTASGGLPVTVTTGDSSKFLLAANATDTPASSIILNVPQTGSRTPDFFVVGVGTGTLGSATLNVAAGNFGACNNTATLVSSGFMMSANAAGTFVSTLQSPVSVQSALTVYPVALDGSLNFLAFQPVAQSVVVPITNSNTSIGSATGPVAFTPGQASGTSTFSSNNIGGSTIVGLTTPTAPLGFSTPASNTSVTVTVLAVVLHICGDPADIQNFGPLAIGFHLEVGCKVTLSQPTTADLTITLTSNNSGKLLLSTDPTVAGQASIQVTIPAGSTQSNPYNLQAAGCPVVDGTQPMCGGPNATTATYTASGGGFTDTGTATLTASGVIFTNGGFFFFASVAGGAVPVEVDLYQLNGGTLGASQPFAPLPGSTTLTVSADTDNHSIGTVTSAVFTGGMQSTNATFTPKAPGTTNVTLTTPAGFGSTGAFQTTQARVNP